ncbi:hypothetical protein Fmac_007196 [Flemingia macrophylla]|uniref:Uncharacterized protein n=1 Tax=Flemingia macrophylla TaxID=520843 RepID=A0ABD1NCS4_9FABA
MHAQSQATKKDFILICGASAPHMSCLSTENEPHVPFSEYESLTSHQSPVTSPKEKGQRML